MFRVSYVLNQLCLGFIVSSVCLSRVCYSTIHDMQTDTILSILYVRIISQNIEEKMRKIFIEKSAKKNKVGVNVCLSQSLYFQVHSYNKYMGFKH